jgi:hypothetical protein
LPFERKKKFRFEKLERSGYAGLSSGGKEGKEKEKEKRK